MAQRLLQRPAPPDVRVEDYGIRGMHLALDLLDGCDLLVLIDALAGDEPPGTVTVLEPDPAGGGAEPLDAHLLDPQAVLAMVAETRRRRRAGARRRLPARRPRRGHRLSPAVAAAVDTAVRMVEDLIAERNAPCSVA